LDDGTAARPDPHKHQVVGVRGCPQELARSVKAKAAADGTNRSAVLVAFMRWYDGQADELPARPGPDQTVVITPPPDAPAG
jgi:hypothetical protein